MPVRHGKDYLDHIDSLGAEVWVEGKRVSGKISEHPAFKGLMKSQAAWYDLQFDPDKKDLLTFAENHTGARVGTSFLVPKTKKDLEKRREAIQEWARLTHGMLGRSPDYMNTAIMSFATSSDLLKGQNEACAQNMRRYFEYIRDHDLSVTHTFILPQVNRSSFYMEGDDEIIGARIVEENKDGLVIHGARLLATQGATTDEIMVFPSGARLPYAKASEPMAYAFAIPNNTPGLKFLCRESFDYGKSSFDHPLGSRFEEMDTIVIFDHVTVPWDRVFLHGNVEVNNQLYNESGFFPHATHLVLSKNIVKVEFLLGIMESMIETISIGEYQHIHEKMTEAIIVLEALKGLVYSSEKQAKKNQWGVMTPDIMPLQAASIYYPKIYPRLIEIIKLLGASGLVSIPTEADFASEEIGADLRRYLQTTTKDGKEKVRLFRLAWDVTMSAFGSRQELYERFFFGDPVRMSSVLYKNYPLTPFLKQVDRLLHEGETD